ncbi:HNH endonuclease [Methylobacterium brachythecii]|uniref:5-methylcytosine-specific restriction endonuclease McrA n=1 Tax=Methylobacterium brachythecii TaxID=1176177 RepID=A0A7W6AJ05_9HYPH|nr:HNH endonuclease [Methylobacterium brachythecii]MBB3904240.1 5-methylcytosine-specific restriction endonuclease McrA [Methylobacterium brachythecii]GLS45099.1 hypothetical protein GCM10007884_30880 [Methylobacterium brachythecii]
MSRTNFSKATKRAALARSGGCCEGNLETGMRCDAPIGSGRPVEFDHVLQDWMGGDATLGNCEALCPPCHKAKTAADAARRAKAKRQFDHHNGIKDPHRRKLQGRGFDKAPKQHPTRAPAKWFGPGMERRP